MGSFAVALFLFAFLAVVKGAFGRGADIAGADRLVTINRISIIQPLPFSYRDQILRIPGVKSHYAQQLVRRRLSGREELLPAVRDRPGESAPGFSELIVPDDQWQKFVADREGAIVGARTAQRFGWKIGDRIPIKNVSYGASGTWEFNIDGIYHSAHAGGDETQFWFQWDYFEERVPEPFKGNIGWYVLQAR